MTDKAKKLNEFFLKKKFQMRPSRLSLSLLLSFDSQRSLGLLRRSVAPIWVLNFNSGAEIIDTSTEDTTPPPSLEKTMHAAVAVIHER